MVLIKLLFINCWFWHKTVLPYNEGPHSGGGRGLVGGCSAQRKILCSCSIASWCWGWQEIRSPFGTLNDFETTLTCHSVFHCTKKGIQDFIKFKFNEWSFSKITNEDFLLKNTHLYCWQMCQSLLLIRGSALTQLTSVVTENHSQRWHCSVHCSTASVLTTSKFLLQFPISTISTVFCSKQTPWEIFTYYSILGYN